MALFPLTTSPHVEERRETEPGDYLTKYNVPMPTFKVRIVPYGLPTAIEPRPGVSILQVKDVFFFLTLFLLTLLSF